MISFALPTWNRADSLKECVESLAFASPDEIVIADDGSTDHTEEIGKQLACQFPFVRYYKFEHAGFAENYKRAILKSDSEYTWTFGDDDRLCKPALEFMKATIANTNYDFYHVTESTRVGKAEALQGTVLDICNWIGFLDFTGFISANIGRTSLMKAGVSSLNYPLYAGCSFPQSMAILEQMASKPAMMVGVGCVDSANWNEGTGARWAEQSICWKYLYISEGLQMMKEKGVIPSVVSETFFRYLQTDLFTRFMGDFNAKCVLTPDSVAPYDWDCFLNLAKMVIEPRGKLIVDWISTARDLQNKYKPVFQAAADAYAKVSEAVNTIQMPVYPFTYLPTGE